MRALLFLLVMLAWVLPWGPVATAGGPQVASALAPIVHALRARPVGAVVEVYADGVAYDPKTRSLERELLSGASWTSAPYGAGMRYTAQRGAASGVIVELPLEGHRTWLLCTHTERTSAAAVDASLGRLRPPPCGASGSYAAITAKLMRAVRPKDVTVVLQRFGVRHPTVLAGPAGIYAIGDLRGASPTVKVGGEPMNLTLKISYDKGHGGLLTVATPTLSGVGPW